VAEVFQIFDKDGNKTIDRTEAQKHWATVRFGKISANEFFNTVDFNGDGEIAFDEFVEFWEIVKGSGHSEEEIKEEVSVVSESRRPKCVTTAN
jgi:Ca2+-binding EF-hand superfamily protein